MKIAINGAGIAGPTLAYWLHRYGHEPVLIERSQVLRSGGYVIDFWGVGYHVATKMGIIRDLQRRAYRVEDVRFVDSDGVRCGGFSTDALRQILGKRFLSLKRCDLSAAVYAATNGQVETIFGNSIAAVHDDGSQVHVEFERGASRRFDMVVGADGLHSRVRELVFGQERQFETYLAYKVAAFELHGYRPRDERVYVSYSMPGRQVSRFSMRDDMTLFLFVYHDPAVEENIPPGNADRIAMLRDVFTGVGWECPRVLARLDEADEIYYDRVSQIEMDSWSRGRTVLVGDAAAAVSLLAGEGSGLAMAEAYALAGELAHAKDAPLIGIAAYQKRMMTFAHQKQKAARRFASAFVPKTEFGLEMRNFLTAVIAWPLLAHLLLRHQMHNDISLPIYSPQEIAGE